MPVRLLRGRGKGTARPRVHEDFEASEERYRILFESSPLPMWLFDLETLAFLAVNDAAVRHYGYSREEFARLTILDLRPPEDVAPLREHLTAIEEKDLGSIWRHRKKDGAVILVEIKAHEFEVEGRRARLVVANDVTARKRAEEALRLKEEQLRQAQKLDAVGRLAGGVAHDFNNLLSVILSYGDIILAELAPNDPIRSDIDEICSAGRRAAELTRQLLTFSRQQVFEARVVDLNEVLGGMDKMLQRILGEDIDLVTIAGKPIGRVKVDPSHIEQVIMNLVVNARDAMPTGGQLTIETSDVTLGQEYVLEHLPAKPGPYVMLAVSDTGCGMDKATQARIFEPFFTTKELGKGTGLGLATVFGIVQQSGGNIWVYSEPDRGTTFKVYLPRVEEALTALKVAAPFTTRRGTETILLVEDEDQVRVVACGILRRNGYQVLEARNAGEALLCCEQRGQSIQLLLTDVVMPQMSGPELAKRLHKEHPEMKVLCMSGYTDDSVVRHGVLDAAFAFIQKPITPETLTRRVREVLDAD